MGNNLWLLKKKSFLQVAELLSEWLCLSWFCYCTTLSHCKVKQNSRFIWELTQEGGSCRPLPLNIHMYAFSAFNGSEKAAFRPCFSGGNNRMLIKSFSRSVKKQDRTHDAKRSVMCAEVKCTVRWFQAIIVTFIFVVIIIKETVPWLVSISNKLCSCDAQVSLQHEAPILFSHNLGWQCK